MFSDDLFKYCINLDKAKCQTVSEPAPAKSSMHKASMLMEKDFACSATFGTTASSPITLLRACLFQADIEKQVTQDYLHISEKRDGHP